MPVGKLAVVVSSLSPGQARAWEETSIGTHAWGDSLGPMGVMIIRHSFLQG
jgi:hypothetical protein